MLQSRRRLVAYSAAAYLALLFPVLLLHEGGHALVCAQSGHTPTMSIDLTGGHLECSGTPGWIFSYYTAGGTVGLAGSAAVVVAWLFFPRHSWLLVAGTAHSLNQVAIVMLEGFFTDVYLSGAISAHLTFYYVGAFFGVVFLLTRLPVSVALKKIE